MTLLKLKVARAEAERFIQRVNELESKINKGGGACTLAGSVESGSVRRASMDLTRSLADLRK